MKEYPNGIRLEKLTDLKISIEEKDGIQGLKLTFGEEDKGKFIDEPYIYEKIFETIKMSNIIHFNGFLPLKMNEKELLRCYNEAIMSFDKEMTYVLIEPNYDLFIRKYDKNGELEALIDEGFKLGCQWGIVTEDCYEGKEDDLVISDYPAVDISYGDLAEFWSKDWTMKDIDCGFMKYAGIYRDSVYTTEDTENLIEYLEDKGISIEDISIVDGEKLYKEILEQYKAKVEEAKKLKESKEQEEVEIER